MEILQQYQASDIKIGDLQLSFYRTCRVPEGKLNSLPAGLGNFPIFSVKDFRSGTPSEWHDEGFFFPMYTQEAMWVGFNRGYHKEPSALVIGAGNINAITGKQFDDKGALEVKLQDPQNYLVIPPQPWLDGWKAEDGKIYQFVAAELGSGETVEGQITGKEEVGGIQLIAFSPKPGQNLVPESRPMEYIVGGSWECFKGTHPYRRSFAASARPTSMGLGRGGEISQKIYPDPYGVEVWAEKPAGVEVLYLVSRADFKQITGHDAPPTPVTYKKYQQLGLPWFEIHDQKKGDTKGSDVFAKLKPVGEGKKVEK
ncbi:MAG: hypothetical protein ABIJ21_08410 [Nanoarchaeota archaeon]